VGMTGFPGREPELARTKAAADPTDATYFSQIEDLVGEEAALLAIPAHQREPHHHERLQTIAADLDRIFEKLHERARRLATEHP
jgi:hypothetical protein